jgi:hypothetical protein
MQNGHLPFLISFSKRICAKHFFRASIIIGVAVVSGCHEPLSPLEDNAAGPSYPSAEKHVGAARNETKQTANDGPKKADLLDEVNCELYNAIQATNQENEKPLARFNAINYVVKINYYLDALSSETANPSLGFFDPLAASSTLFGIFIGGQFSSQQHYNITWNSTVLTSNFPENYKKDYRGAHNGAEMPIDKNRVAICGRQIGGSLELTSIINDESLRDADRNDGGPKYEDIMKEKSKYGPGGVLSGHPEAASMQFGGLSATIDFTLIKSVNGGPGWTLAHFKGPTATSGTGTSQGISGTGISQGLLNASRTTQDKVIIALAPQCRRRIKANVFDDEYGKCLKKVKHHQGERDKCEEAFIKACRDEYESIYKAQAEWICSLPTCDNSSLENAQNANEMSIEKQETNGLYQRVLQLQQLLQ